MYIRNCTSSLIFFALLGQKIGDACLPVGREDRNAQISIWHQLYSYLFCLPAKSYNHIFNYSLLETFPRDLPTEKVGDRRKKPHI